MRTLRRRRARPDKPGDWTRGERFWLGYLWAFGALWFLLCGIATLAGIYGIVFASRYLGGVVLVLFGVSMIIQGRYLLALTRRFVRRVRHHRLREEAETRRDHISNADQGTEPT